MKKDKSGTRPQKSLQHVNNKIWREVDTKKLGANDPSVGKRSVLDESPVIGPKNGGGSGGEN